MSKESKISELRQNLTVNSEINRLQNEVKRLYQLNRGSAKEKIDHVAGEKNLDINLCDVIYQLT